MQVGKFHESWQHPEKHLSLYESGSSIKGIGRTCGQHSCVVWRAKHNSNNTIWHTVWGHFHVFLTFRNHCAQYSIELATYHQASLAGSISQHISHEEGSLLHYNGLFHKYEGKEKLLDLISINLTNTIYTLRCFIFGSNCFHYL